jgi:hypothetical protein
VRALPARAIQPLVDANRTSSLFSSHCVFTLARYPHDVHPAYRPTLSWTIAFTVAPGKIPKLT